MVANVHILQGSGEAIYPTVCHSLGRKSLGGIVCTRESLVIYISILVRGGRNQSSTITHLDRVGIERRHLAATCAQDMHHDVVVIIVGRSVLVASLVLVARLIICLLYTSDAADD